MLMLLAVSFCGCRQAKPSSLDSITIDGVKSYYMYSNVESGSKEGLPVIIIIDHPLGGCTSPERFAVKFDEPVLLIWCKLLDDLSDHFGFDERRVYLTGFSSTGIYAWMLAYDRPDLYSGVVAMSVVSYPQQIQQNLESGESIVTVVVIGQNDPVFLRREEQERQRGRVIESRNPHSKFVLKQGEDHRSIEKYWLQYLNYVLQFSKPDVSPSGS
jgi:pimeloyl-ACP methyl ester carboxylesterase